jgi:hemerythrin
MKSVTYPGLERHTRQHQGLIDRLETLHTDFQRGNRDASADLMNLLSSWWTTHTASADADLAAHIRAAGKRAA